MYRLFLTSVCIHFVSAKSDKSVQNILEKCSRLLLSPFYKLECAILSFIVTIHHDIWDKHITTQQENMFPHELGQLNELLLRRSPKKWTICLDYPRLSWGIELRLVTVQLILSYGWLQFRQLDTSCGWFYPRSDSNSSGWIGVAVDSILRLTWVPAAGYELWLIPSPGWFEFQQLDRSCGWFYHTTYSSSSGWTWVAADSILWLFQVMAAGYELWLTLSCGWLESRRLDSSYSWFHPAADYELQLILPCGWLKICWLDSTCNISSKFKDLFCKIHRFYNLFSISWF